MILLFMLLLALGLSFPVLLALLWPVHPAQRRETTLALYRAQLVELERDQTSEEISASSYTSARLEIEHRLLAADRLPPDPKGGSAKLLLILAAFILPIGGFALYMPGATPFLPSVPHAWLMKKQAQEEQKLDRLIMLLRAHLAQVPPDSADASQGQAYLAETLTEQAGGITAEALSLFKKSLAHAPLQAPWRTLDQQRILQAGAVSQSGGTQ